GPAHTEKADPYARQATKRQQREAVREAQGQGNVEGAFGDDRQPARRLEPRRPVIRLRHAPWQLQPGWNDCPEEGRRPQGRPRYRAQELTRTARPRRRSSSTTRP